jgi:hypothetical protein
VGGNLNQLEPAAGLLRRPAAGRFPERRNSFDEINLADYPTMLKKISVLTPY